MSIECLGYTDINVALKAGLVCTDSVNNIDKYNAAKFLSNLIKNEHYSVIEHINYSFYITSVSRAMLQELARHRHASLSVKSTRWALKKFASKAEFYFPEFETNDENKDIMQELNVLGEQLSALIEKGAAVGIPNDILKYHVQESLCTDLVYTVNARELMHIFNLRTSNRALKEFNKFCYNLYDVLPEDHKFMFDNVMHRD